MEEIIEFFDGAKMFFIATIEGNQPRVRPFGGLILFKNKLYFNTNSTKKVYKQMIENPKVELCAFNKGIWMRVEGVAVKESKDELKEAMFEAQPGVAKLYQGKENIFEIFELQQVIAKKYSVKGEEIVYKYNQGVE